MRTRRERGIAFEQILYNYDPGMATQGTVISFMHCFFRFTRLGRKKTVARRDGCASLFRERKP
jgi:hypothetical protein